MAVLGDEKLLLNADQAWRQAGGGAAGAGARIRRSRPSWTASWRRRETSCWRRSRATVAVRTDPFGWGTRMVRVDKTDAHQIGEWTGWQISVQMTRQMIDEVLRQKNSCVPRLPPAGKNSPIPARERGNFPPARGLARVRPRPDVMLYLDILSEVRTRWFLAHGVERRGARGGALLRKRRDRAVPAGSRGRIDARHHRRLGAGGERLRGRAERKIDRSGLDLIVIPGLASTAAAAAWATARATTIGSSPALRGDATSAGRLFRVSALRRSPRLCRTISACI